MNWTLYRFVGYIFWVLDLLILLRVLFSWINLGSGNPVVNLIYRATEPILAPLRRYISPLGGLDITPMVALLLLEVVQRLVLGLLF